MSAAAHRLRQGVYRVLGAGYAPPSDEFLRVAVDSATVLDDLGLYDYSYAPRIAAMLHEFGAADHEELTRSYQQLFETGVDGEVCANRESARLGDARVGETARLLAELRAAQESFGVTVPADRVDHASTELTSMATLCGRIAEHPDDTHGIALLRRQAGFARDHVLRWIPSLGRQVEELAPHAALRSLGSATVAFLEHERQQIALMLDDRTTVRP